MTKEINKLTMMELYIKISFLINNQAVPFLLMLMIISRCRLRVVRMMVKTNQNLTLSLVKVTNSMFRNHRILMRPTRSKIRVMTTYKKKLMSRMKQSRKRVASLQTLARSKIPLNLTLKFRSKYRIKSHPYKITH